MARKPPLHVSLAAVPGSLSSPITGLYELLGAFPIAAEYYDSVPTVSPFEVEIVGPAQTTITAPSGLPIAIQRAIGDIEKTDIVIVSTMAVNEGSQNRHPELADWMRRMGGSFSIASPVAEMTRMAGLSSRAFERRFKSATGYSPIDYVQRVRVEEAKRRLEQSDIPIDQISWDVGYEDAAAFRRLFKRIARLTPGAYRRKFSMPELVEQYVHFDNGPRI